MPKWHENSLTHFQARRQYTLRIVKFKTHFQTKMAKKSHPFGSMYLWEAGMVQWWERSSPTSVAWVWFLDSASYVGWVCCWSSSFLWGFVLQVLQFFFPPQKLTLEAVEICTTSWISTEIPIYFYFIPFVCRFYKGVPPLGGGGADKILWGLQLG